MNSLSFVPCQQKSAENEPEADQVLDFIKSETKPLEFDEKIKTLAVYKLHSGGFNGWNALGKAASMGNVALIKHIAAKNPHLVNLGNGPGWTPLLCASGHCQDPHAALKAARELIKAGANVNMVSTDAQCMDDGMVWGDGIAPLHLAVFNNNRELAKLLIKKGAAGTVNISQTDVNKIIESAQAELKMEDRKKMLFLAGTRKNPGSILTKLPNELKKMIFGMIKEMMS